MTPHRYTRSLDVSTSECWGNSVRILLCSSHQPRLQSLSPTTLHYLQTRVSFIQEYSPSTLYDMALINTLSSELLTSILRSLQFSSHDSHNSDFIRSFQVCGLWRDIGQELLWTDIHLDDQRLLRFLKNSPKTSPSVLSLTISLDPRSYRYQPDEIGPRPDVYGASSRTIGLWNALRQIPERLKRMPKLQTFSFKIRGYSSFITPLGFWLRQKDMYEILKSLPASVVNLEVDTWCQDHRETMDKNSHICEALATRLAGLSSVRLRLSNICTHLLSGPTSNDTANSTPPVIDTTVTRSNTEIVVNAIGPNPLLLTEECGSPVLRRFDRFEVNLRCNTLMRKLLEVGSITLSTIEMSEPLPGRDNDKIFHALSRRSNAPRSSVISPCFQIGNGYSCVRQKDRMGLDVEVCCKSQDAEAVVEESGWVETIKGCRFPRKHVEQNRRFTHVALKPPLYWIKNGLREGTNRSAQIWTTEKNEGRFLLHQVKSDNLDDVGVVTRKLTTAESWRLRKRGSVPS